MQIHVVTAGQTIYGIANAYSISPKEIIDANQLDAPNQLVVGQALVIPITGSYYWVQSGDSLYSIGQKFNITAQELARINNISIDAPINVGLRLYIPPQQTKRFVATNAYIEPRGSTVSPALQNSAREASPYLTYLAPFSFEVNRDGSLKEPPLNNFNNIANAAGTTLMMVLTNLENGEFSTDLARVILNDMTVQNNLLNNIISTANRLNFGSIHFDFERLRPEDSGAYTRFLKRAKEMFTPQRLTTSIALAPKTSATQLGEWLTAHNYREQGNAVDFVIIMTYEWGYSGGPAQAVSPINQVGNVLDYAISEIPSNKILMGQNLYGYDWTLPFRPGTTARAVSPQQAIALARRYNAIIQYDTIAQAPFFRYFDEMGRQHEVWFEDARSIQAKFDLIKTLRLGGISYWKLGLSFPQNWLLLEDNFRIYKI